MKSKLSAVLAAAAIAVSGAVALAAPASADVYYKNCDAVRAAGKDPLYRGDPGYRPALDRDNDGIACEPRGGSKRDDSNSSKDDSSKDEDSTTTRETEKSTSRSDNSSSRRSYSQVGEDDVPVGGVATGGG